MSNQGSGGTGPALLADVVRSSFVESHHRGSLVALGADGEVVLTLGEPDRPVFPRSSNKPLQAVGMLRAGLDLDGELLALACASHSGEDFHLDGVGRILAGAGLDESALQTPPDLPLDEQARRAWLVAGRSEQPIAMNCSGKHAAMLATCVATGAPPGPYLDAAHPVQQAIAATVEDLAGERVASTGVDGCGAPVLALSLLGLARAFRAVVTAGPETPERRVAAAVAAYPEWLGGTSRDVTAFLRALPGSLAKDGAEGVYALALPDGRAIAMKVDDGAQRARPPVLVAALRRLGVESPELDEIAAAPVLGGGQPVGRVRAVL